MKKPYELGKTVMTPKGLGYITNLSRSMVTVEINKQRKTFPYKDVELSNVDEDLINSKRVFNLFDKNKDLIKTSPLFKSLVKQMTAGMSVEDALIEAVKYSDNAHRSLIEYLSST